MKLSKNTQSYHISNTLINIINHRNYNRPSRLFNFDEKLNDILIPTNTTENNNIKISNNNIDNNISKNNIFRYKFPIYFM